MSKQNNIYSILAAFNKATAPEEVATPKQQAKMIYESVEAKGSIMGGVKGVEKKLSEAFAAHKEQVSELSTGTLKSYGKKAEKDSAKHLSKAAKLTDKAYSQYNKGGATADKSWDTIDKAEKHVDKSEKRAAGADKAAGKIASKTSNGANESLGDVAALGVIGAGAGAALGAAVHTPFGKTNRSVSDRVSDFRKARSSAKEVSDADFKKKYGKSKADMRKSMSGKKDEKKKVDEDYPKHQDLGGISTDKLKAYINKQSAQQVAGEGNQVKRVKAELQRRQQQGMEEAAGDDIQWYDRPADGDTTTDTETGRIHKAGRGGYGNKVDDETPMALPQGQVARGRGRPKNLAGELKRKAAAERLAANQGVKQGRGRPKKAVAGSPDSAPQGTLGLHRFLFGPTPTSDTLPGKKGAVHKIKDTGTVKNPNAVDTGEFDEGLGDDFAAMARGMKNKDGTPRFTTVRQGPAPTKAPTAKPAMTPRPSGPAASGPADWYDQSTGGKRNMGDSKINRKAAVSEGTRPTNFKGYLTEAGGQDAFEHILNRYKHEVKNFQAGGDMDDDLYEALFDYYLNAGEMPYGVAKARTGDPVEWVAARFDQDNPAMEEAVDPLTVPAYQRKAAGQEPLSLDQVRAPRADSISDKRNLAHANGTRELDDLARLAGITTESISVIGGDEGGEMDSGMEAEDESKMNISTNQSSDGTKSITVTADGEAAVALLDMLKNAGMGGSDAAAEQEVIIAAQGDEHMGDEMSMDDGVEMEEEYQNEPAPAYQSVDAMMSRGDDMNREKKQNWPMRQPGNNPMAGEEQVNELSKGTLGSYAKKANAERSDPSMDDMKADRRGTGVMKAIDKAAGYRAGPIKGNAAQARFSAANGQPNAEKDRQSFERSVDRVTKEATDPVKSMGRDLMAEYQAMKIKK